VKEQYALRSLRSDAARGLALCLFDGDDDVAEEAAAGGIVGFVAGKRQDVGRSVLARNVRFSRIISSSRTNATTLPNAERRARGALDGFTARERIANRVATQAADCGAHDFNFDQ